MSITILTEQYKRDKRKTTTSLVFDRCLRWVMIFKKIEPEVHSKLANNVRKEKNQAGVSIFM